jgi:antitoxin (DNA-binding transcriptional repressor) of toxin-antitoxin stability system
VCAVVISHDRFFLDRLATHILAFEGGSHVGWLEGNVPPPSVEPHCVTFKTFDRSVDAAVVGQPNCVMVPSAGALAMDDISIAQAKETLEDLVVRAQRGEDVRITDQKLGRVRIVPDVATDRMADTLPPFVPLAQDRVLGHLKGKMQVPARLMEPMSNEELRNWYGEDA